jgi:hypothetical protein
MQGEYTLAVKRLPPDGATPIPNMHFALASSGHTLRS